MKKQYYIKGIIQDGENEYETDFLMECEEKDKDKELHNFLKDFFGEETKLEDGIYTSFLRSIRIRDITEIPKEDFEILKKYIFLI